MPLPDVSVVEVDQESTIVEETPTVEILTDTVEVASLLLDSEDVAIIEVGIQGPPGAGGAGTAAQYEPRSDIVSDELVYRGEALPGTAEDAAGWRISKTTIAYGPQLAVTVLWAGARGFTQKWSERAALTYTE